MTKVDDQIRGLIIAEPWITKILAGEKTWEMRGKNVSRRGLIALIRAGSLTVVGVAKVVDSRGPFTSKELDEHFERHHVPRSVFESTPKWNRAWVLTEAVRLANPIRYVHPKGAQDWVILAPECEAAIKAQLST